LIERLLDRIAAELDYLAHHEVAWRSACIRKIQGGRPKGELLRWRLWDATPRQRLVAAERVWLSDPMSIPALTATIRAASRLNAHFEMQPVVDWLTATLDVINLAGHR